MHFLTKREKRILTEAVPGLFDEEEWAGVPDVFKRAKLFVGSYFRMSTTYDYEIVIAKIDLALDFIYPLVEEANKNNAQLK